MPERAIATKHQSAMTEKRSAVAARSLPSRGRITASATSPPTQTVAATRWTARELTAVAWSLAAAEWPPSERGRTASTAMTDAHAIVARLRASSAIGTSSSATPVVMSCTRVAMNCHANVVNCCPKAGSDTGMPMKSAIPSTATVSEASAHTAAAMAASRVAVARRCVLVVSGMRYAASPRRPIVAAAARSCTTRA
jgi:hypothetical protein